MTGRANEPYFLIVGHTIKVGRNRIVAFVAPKKGRVF